MNCLARLYRLSAAIASACCALTLFVQPAQASHFEAGTFVAHDTLGTNRDPDRVNFQQAFDVPPIVIAIGSSNGNNSATVRITNVTTTGFDELILEPDNWDGRHLSMVTHYIAIEPGRHVLPDGRVVEAGLINTSVTQFGTGFTGGVSGWASVSFSSALPGTPTVLHNLQTANSEERDVANQASRPHITSIARSLSATGFQIAIDRSQANSGSFPGTEQIGWVAFPAGQSGSFPDTSGSTVSWSARTTGPAIRGWDDGCVSQTHGLNSASAVVVAKKVSRNNNDGGWLRYCTINAATISLRVDEDRDQDDERSVAASDAEQAGLIAFSRPFHAELQPSISITKTRLSVVDEFGTDFALPTATIDYLITVSNGGNTAPNYDSVIITEKLPSDLALIVTDYSGPSGPVLFADGTPATGLSCAFISPSSNTDCFDFSTDGIDYTHEPVAGPDGTDPLITHVRVRPVGYMAPNTAASPSQFSLRLRGRIR